jgi:hypothetical protein
VQRQRLQREREARESQLVHSPRGAPRRPPPDRVGGFHSRLTDD